MSADKASRIKTLTLSLRLDPKTRFMLEFMSRIRGQSITVVVERAIKEAARKTVIGDQYDGRGNELPQYSWSDFWDPDEVVRTLNLIGNSDYPTTFEEDELRQFTLDHWEFFYKNSSGSSVQRAYSILLWPQMHVYLNSWKATKSTDYWAAGKLMADDLHFAGIKPPVWPRNPEQKTKTPDPLDDVPF